MGQMRYGDLSEIPTQSALQLDLGARFGKEPNIFLGGYVGVGGSTGSTTTPDGRKLDSGSTATRVGFQVQYHLRPMGTGTLDPWVGYGLGIETGGRTLKGPGFEKEVSLSGFEFAHFTLGLDYQFGGNGSSRTSAWGSIGPVIDFSIAQYRTIEERNNGATVPGLSDSAPGLHEWFMMGLRVAFWP
jgi:hypothetical protein